MAYKEILSQDVKTFSCIKEGNVNCPPLIDPTREKSPQDVSQAYLMYKRYLKFWIFYYPYVFDEGDGIK